MVGLAFFALLVLGRLLALLIHGVVLGWYEWENTRLALTQAMEEITVSAFAPVRAGNGPGHFSVGVISFVDGGKLRLVEKFKSYSISNSGKPFSSFEISTLFPAEEE